jgi:L-alanine-DL-glutamate epimerase-like enolase superfamily enzyme
MLIQSIRTTRLSIPWVEVPKWGFAPVEKRTVLIVEIETQSGIVGMGYLQPLMGGVEAIEACIRHQLKPLLLGQDASRIEWLWRTMYRSTHTVGRMGVALFALSAVDIALWDALGKKAGLPLYRLWGGSREELPIYGSGCFRGLGGDGMIEKARRYVAQGFGAIKMQVAHVHDNRTDLENARRMRQALGDRTEIMIDVNQGWSADVAILMGRKFEEQDIYWLEEPVPADDFDGTLRVARALDLRVVCGENHCTRYDLRPFFRDPVLPILQPDVMRGGLTELRKIAAVADTYGIAIAPHLFHELMSHLLASIPNGSWLEYMGWMDDLWVEPLIPAGGKVMAPQRPGHGMAFKPEVLREFAVKQ